MTGEQRPKSGEVPAVWHSRATFCYTQEATSFSVPTGANADSPLTIAAEQQKVHSSNEPVTQVTPQPPVTPKPEPWWLMAIGVVVFVGMFVVLPGYGAYRVYAWVTTPDVVEDTARNVGDSPTRYSVDRYTDPDLTDEMARYIRATGKRCPRVQTIIPRLFGNTSDVKRYKVSCQHGDDFWYYEVEIDTYHADFRAKAIGALN